jgi:hypothetical protein
MSRLAEEFDALSGLPEPERARALAALAATEPELAASLRMLLDAESDRVPDPPDVQRLLDFVPTHRDLGGFRLIAPLGKGGMGEVWRGERIQSGVTQRVAVKLLRADRHNADLARRFLDEQQIVAQLSHPNIVRLIGMGQMSEGTPWLAMDLIHGEPLLTYCDRGGLTVRQRVQLLVKVLAAVQHAHQQLIVHRDLKSEHVLIDADGEPRLLDFGIARRLDRNAGVTGPAGGFFSACNVSPEQLLGDPVGVATDVYQLGLLLYRLVCGYDAQTREGVAFADLQRNVLDFSPPPPSDRVDADAARLRGASTESLRRELRGDLDRVILHALRAAPAERYPTAAAFGDDLRAWLECRPVQAMGQGRRYRLRKFLQRHRTSVAVVTGAAVLLGAAGITLLRNELALARAHREAISARDAAALHAARAEQVRDLLLDLFRAADPALDGVPGNAARIDDAVAELRRRESVDAAPELALALSEAAMGLGQHESARMLLDDLDGLRLPVALQRQRLLLLARLAVATQNLPELRERLEAVAPLMGGATELEDVQYLRLISGVLLAKDPERVLRLTHLDPLPPLLMRTRARALLKLDKAAEAERLLRASLERADVRRPQRLGLQQALVTALIDQGQGAAAEQISRELIDDARPLLGADSRAMLGYWNTRALALAAAGRPEAAVAVLNAQLARPDLAPGIRNAMELNQLLFGTAMVPPDPESERLLDQKWPLRARYGLEAQRMLLLARVRLLVHQRRPDEARQILAASFELSRNSDVESKLLRHWARALGLSPAEPADRLEARLASMDPQLVAFERSRGNR